MRENIACTTIHRACSMNSSRCSPGEQSRMVLPLGAFNESLSSVRLGHDANTGLPQAHFSKKITIRSRFWKNSLLTKYLYLVRKNLAPTAPFHHLELESLFPRRELSISRDRALGWGVVPGLTASPTYTIRKMSPSVNFQNILILWSLIGIDREDPFFFGQFLSLVENGIKIYITFKVCCRPLYCDKKCNFRGLTRYNTLDIQSVTNFLT